MVCLGNAQRSFCHFWDCPQELDFIDFCWLWWLLHFFYGILSHTSRYNDQVKFAHHSPLVHWFLKCWCSLLSSPVWPPPFTLIHGPNFLGSYALLLLTASDFTSITSHIQNWVLFLLWLCLFILSGVISPFILGTYQPGKFIFQCHIFLPFHTVRGVLKARTLKWFAIPFSTGPCFGRTLHHGPMWCVS